MQFRILAAMFLAVIVLSQPAFAQTSLEEAISTIKKVDVNGVGHDDAVKAIKVLNAASVDQVPVILNGMDDANKLAVNWLRSAVVSVVGKSEGGIPVDKIKAYFENKDGSHLGRLLAYDLLNEADSNWGTETVSTLVDDPSLPLRRKGISSWILKAKDATGTEALGTLAVALEKAREADQVIEIAELLDERGVSVNVQKQLGFIHTWHLAGNFDNKDQGGFDVAHGPEKSLDKIDLEATYKDIDDKDVKWQVNTTAESTGVVDLNEAIGKVKGVTVYATSTFKAEDAAPCEIRVGCINAHKVWINGKLVMSNEIYHNGISPDKFSAPAGLVKGDNQILVKVCQNEQSEPWAQRWQFQLRICDETGKAIPPAKPAPQRF